MDVLTPLYPLLDPSGYLVIDDYGHYIQCRRALHDYLHLPFQSADGTPLKDALSPGDIFLGAVGSEKDRRR